MKEFHIILLLCFVMAAVLSDLRSGRIPNGVIAAGLACGMAYQLFANGPFGILLSLGGAILPILIFGGFFYLRMIGAGDIKLMCMAGGFLGPSGCFACTVLAIFLGGLISVGLMLYHHNFGRRLAYFTDYVSRRAGGDPWEAYMDGAGEDAKFCFSVPILLGILVYIGSNI